MKKLKFCPVCGESKLEHEETTSLCMSCGFMSSKGYNQTAQVEAFERTMPKLVVALRFLDRVTGQYWFPIIINIPDIGILFPDGTNVKDWYWSFARSIPIPLFERPKYPISTKPGEFYERKLDIEHAEVFNKMKFSDAFNRIMNFAKE